MAVDSNVLINERIREELAANKPLNLAIKNSFDRTFWTILDTHATALIAALFLFVFGTGPIRGFATTLSLGIILSMFTTLFIGKTIFSFCLNSGLQSLPMVQLFKSTKINFLKARYICLTISAILVAVGMYSFFSRKDNVYSIDFRGGQILEYKISPVPQIEDVRNTLKEAGLPDLIIQDFKDIPGGINIKSKDEVADKVESVLKSHYKTVEKLAITKVGPTVGALLKKKAFSAVLFSLIGILIYIFMRFKHFDFALAGVIGLLYDVLIALGAISFFGYEVDLLIITALLTIAGYSISDTIVVYDRVREISPRLSKLSLGEILNAALNQTFSRTVITTFTVFLVTFSLYLLAGRALKAFSFALMIGFLSGVYSTIYISASLIVIFRRVRVD
jgi:SecD/SecF fusion protein